jgi:hypothetical protein
MKTPSAPLDLKKIKVQPLSKRQSRVALERVLATPDQPPPPCSAEDLTSIRDCAVKIKAAREKGAAAILFLGAPVVASGLQPVINHWIERGFFTHLATDSAGAIHDWEFAFLGSTGENVRENISDGTFGTWDQTSRNIHLALLSGALNGQGFGQSVGKFIEDDGVKLPSPLTLEKDVRDAPSHPLGPARAELLRAMTTQKLAGGRVAAKHPHKVTSLLATAYRRGVPFTVHPTIGGDSLATHPVFRGAVLGRAADIDFRLLGSSLDRLDGGVLVAIDPPLYAPAVLEASLSCVNNLRIQDGKPPLRDHSLVILKSPADNHDGDSSFSHLGGNIQIIRCDANNFVRNLSGILGE